MGCKNLSALALPDPLADRQKSREIHRYERNFFMYEKIVLAYDGSLEGQKALINCKEMALWGDAVIHLISVIPDIVVYPTGDGTFIDTESQEIVNEDSQHHLDNGVAFPQTSRHFS